MNLARLKESQSWVHELCPSSVPGTVTSPSPAQCQGPVSLLASVPLIPSLGLRFVRLTGGLEECLISGFSMCDTFPEAITRDTERHLLIRDTSERSGGARLVRTWEQGQCSFVFLRVKVWWSLGSLEGFVLNSLPGLASLSCFFSKETKTISTRVLKLLSSFESVYWSLLSFTWIWGSSALIHITFN